MSNPIKYSTGSESLALKKGNFYIGTGDVDKGPTETTGYYNGITPPEGGYTIYLNKETGGPSIYTCANDNELISLTNKIADTSYTTANECLVYFAGQNDKMVLNRDYEGIVTDGLVFNIDAGFTPSYPKNGTTWYDLSGNGNNGTLTNGSTFDSGNNGSIVFDGVDDQVQLGSISNTNPLSLFGTTGFTISVWFNATSGGDSYQRLIDKSNAGSARYGFAVSRPQNSTVRGIELYVGGAQRLTSGFSNYYNFGEWVNVTITCDIVNVTNDWRSTAYFNGISQVTDNRTNMPSYWPQITTNAAIGTWNHSTAREFKGNISNIAVYNKVLSSTEIQHNFNVLRGRFGL